MTANQKLCYILKLEINLLRLFSSKNLAATSGPNMQPTPLFEGDLPGASYGSDQRSSHINPSSGGSLRLSTAAI